MEDQKPMKSKQRRFFGFCMHKSTALTLEIIAITLAILIAAWIALFARLKHAPIDINFAIAPITTQVSETLEGYSLNITGAQLIWAGLDRGGVELQLNDLTLVDERAKTTALIIPQIGVEVSRRALLQGLVRPASIRIYDTALRFTRTEDGKLTIGMGQIDKPNEDPINQDEERTTNLDIEQIFDTPVLSFLKRLIIVNADIAFADQTTGKIISSRRSRLAIKRSETGLNGQLTHTLHMNALETPLSTSFSHTFETGTTRLLSRFDSFDLENLKQYIPAMSKYDLSGEVSGVIFTSFDDALNVKRLRASLSAQEGRIAEKGMGFEVVYDSGRGAAQYDIKTKRFILEKFDILSGDRRIGISANTKPNADESAYMLEAVIEVDNAAVDDVSKIWPGVLAEPAYAWVADNLSGGRVPSARIGFDGTINTSGTDNPDQKPFTLTNLDGRVDVTGASLRYMPNFPPLNDVKSTVRFSKSDITIDVSSATYKDLSVTSGRVVIDEFKPAPARITIQTRVESSIPTALEVIDSKPLNFASKAKLLDRGIKGESALDLYLQFPLVKKLKAGDMSFTAKGTLSDVEWPNVAIDQSLSAGTLALDLTPKALKLSGGAKLSSKDADILWTTDFSSAGKPFSTLNVRTTATREAVAFLIEGEFPLNLTYTQSGTSQKVNVKANLKDSAFMIPEYDVQKSIGSDGQVSFDAELNNGVLTRLSNIMLTSPELAFLGSVTFAPPTDAKAVPQLQTANLTKLRFKANDINVSAKREQGRIVAEVTGSQLDLRPFTGNTQNNKTATAKKKNVLPLTLSASVDRAVFSQNQPIEKTKIFLKRGVFSQIEQFELDGLAGGAQVYVRYKPSDDGQRKTFRMEADNAGAALSALGLTQSVRGGTLIIDGAPTPGQNLRDVEGRIQLSNFSLVGAPALARLLGAMSLGGMQELLSSDGLSFSRLKSTFFWSDHIDTNGNTLLRNLRLKDGRTSGSSLGLTFDGDINVQTKNMHLKGTIVPASGLNKAVGSIPLVGGILTGGSGAVFAATYSMKGPLATPTTTVNPVAALAPGFLRTLFFEND